MQPTERGAGAGLGWGALAGIFGALGMALVSSVLVGVVAFVAEGPGAGFGVGFIYLMFGSFFAAGIGSVGGALLGFVLAATRRVDRAPIVGALTPPVVIVPGATVWVLSDFAVNIFEVVAIAFGVSLLYVPFGLAAGMFYARRMAA